MLLIVSWLISICNYVVQAALDDVSTMIQLNGQQKGSVIIFCFRSLMFVSMLDTVFNSLSAELV